MKVTGMAWHQLVRLAAWGQGCRAGVHACCFLLQPELVRDRRWGGSYLTAQVQVRGLEDSQQLALGGWGGGRFRWWM